MVSLITFDGSVSAFPTAKTGRALKKKPSCRGPLRSGIGCLQNELLRYPRICCLFTAEVFTESAESGHISQDKVPDISRHPAVSCKVSGKSREHKPSGLELHVPCNGCNDRFTTKQTVSLKQWRIRTSESSRKSSSYRSGIPSVQRRRHHPDPVSRQSEVSGIRYAFIIAVSERIII